MSESPGPVASVLAVLVPLATAVIRGPAWHRRWALTMAGAFALTLLLIWVIALTTT